MNECKIIQKLIEMDEKIDGLATQEHVDARFNDVMTTLDAHSRTLARLDEERLVGIERTGRIEEDIRRLKMQSKPI